VNRKSEPFVARLVTGLIRPKNPILGAEFAGEIEAVGKDVTRYKEVDPVLGSASISFGCWAEYVCMPEEGFLGMKPANVTYEEAAAACDGVLTALPFLRDAGEIQGEQCVLINGASASIGTFAVQLAKDYGAEVTGVCSTTNLDMVKSLGADRVIDYTQDDFTKADQTYDIIFDVVAKSSFSRCKASLTQNGIYLSTFPTPGTLLPRLGSKKARFLATGLRPLSEKIKDLLHLRELMETGKIRTVIDRRYPLEQTAEAHRYVEKGHKKGNVVITVEHGS